MTARRAAWEGAAKRLARAREFALALPEAMEAPHFEANSFRVKGKIFATVPPEGDRLHVMMGEEDVAPFLAQSPDAFERLFWGAKLSGLRVWIERADEADVEEALELAWRRKAPKKVVNQYDLGRSPGAGG